MSATMTFKSKVTTSEILAAASVPAASAEAYRTVIHDDFDTEVTLDDSSTPVISEVVAAEITLSGGAIGIDLTALVGTNGKAVDMTGLKVQVIKFKAPAANTIAINVTVGIANGYELAGAGFDIDVEPGAEWTFYGSEATPDVGAAACELDLTGAGVEMLEVMIAAG